MILCKRVHLDFERELFYFLINLIIKENNCNWYKITLWEV